MIRHFTVLVTALLCLVLLTSCAATTSEDTDAAVGRWSKKEAAIVDDDPTAVAVLFAAIDGGHSPRGTAITTGFEESQTIARLVLSCYGTGTMDGVLSVTTSKGSSSTEFPGLHCADGPQRLEMPASAVRSVDKLSFRATNSSQESAWQLVARR
ncbi:hypothetical protein [Curtobacterium pusillum]|uniref:hypothetical protein n=1 Tax=Curtobacterium pusillum TaxID=69373 RepID=UPI0011A80124|nr:hypothetical protein [Curtobacterium pusillum]